MTQVRRLHPSHLIVALGLLMGAVAGLTMMVMQAIDPDYAKKLPQTEKWRGKELALITVTTAVACEDHPTWMLRRAIEETYKELLAVAALRNQH
jgi:hypothetical protein